jgi:hypothetical protein
LALLPSPPQDYNHPDVTSQGLGAQYLKKNRRRENPAINNLDSNGLGFIAGFSSAYCRDLFFGIWLDLSRHGG